MFLKLFNSIWRKPSFLTWIVDFHLNLITFYLLSDLKFLLKTLFTLPKTLELITFNIYPRCVSGIFCVILLIQPLFLLVLPLFTL